jgi:hypothetical protein
VRLIPLTMLLPACKLLRERVARRASSEVSWKQRDHQKRHQRHQVEYWVVASTLSLIVAGFSLIFARRSVKASRELIKQQKQPARYAGQPMLWVDIRGDDGQGEALVLLLGNSGPSIARNVRVSFDPAPPVAEAIKPILAILKQGIASLPPGRTMQWVLGAADSRVNLDADIPYRVRIEAEGPSGRLEPLEYVPSINDLDASRAARPANLHAVAVELHEMTKATKELNEIIRSASLEPA